MPADLATFLAERLDEAEAAAKAAELRFPGPWEQAENTDSPLPSAVTLYDSRDESVGVIRGSYAAAHIAANDPARTLRAIAAKRRILELSNDADWLDKTLDEEVARTPKPGETTLGEEIRRAIAAEWDDHPAYQPEWSPEPATAP